ncbi:MAG: flagellar biosynthesis protein FlhG [Clostridia bacterium]|nr:flagellar biosynthesis protein FlhG [Clostridia bacterium]
MSVLLKVNQTIKLEPQSLIYNRSYESTIFNIADTTFTIKMPYDNGKLVLLSVGTMLKVTIEENQTSFISEVLGRTFSPEPSLTLALPVNLLDKKTQKSTKFISITSGKGGVGKTSFTINLGITLSQMGYRTFIIDADLGTANVDVLLNLQPKYNLKHILNREKDILDIIIDGPGGIHLIPGGSGLQNLADLDEWQFNRLINSFQVLEKYADVILIDTGAGLSKNVINFILASDEVIVVTTPEPHAITDAYAIIKVMDERDTTLNPKLILNRVESPEEAKKISEKMIKVTDHFLSLKLESLGYILEDSNVLRAIKKLRPFVLTDPLCPAAQCVKNISQRLIKPDANYEFEVRKNFFHRVKELFNR